MAGRKRGPPGEGRTDAAPTPTALACMRSDRLYFSTRNEVTMIVLEIVLGVLVLMAFVVAVAILPHKSR